MPVLFYVFSLLCLLATSSQANEYFTVENNIKKYDLGTEVEYLVDASNRLDIHNLLTSSQAWQKSQVDIPNFGFTPSPHWFHINLKNTGNKDSRRLLNIAYPLLDYINFYIVENGVIKRHIQNGDHLPFSERLVKHRQFIFPVVLKPQQDTHLYIRIETSSSMQLPLELWDQQAFFERDQINLFGQGLFFGMLAIMGLYNLFMWIGTRDKSYAFYVLYVFGIGLFQLSFHGLAYQLLWPESPLINDRALGVLIPFFIVFAILFISAFFDLKKRLPFTYQLVLFFCLINILLIIAAGFMDYGTVIRLETAISVVTAFCALGIGLIMWARRHPSALIFNVAWTIFISGGLVIALNKMGLVPRNFLTENSLQLGAAIEIFVLSLALTERWNRERKERLYAQGEALALAVKVSEERQEKFQAQQQLLESEKRAKNDLERRVQERTRELEVALTDLSSANEKLQNISKTDALTGVRNRRYFDEKLQAEFKRHQRENTPLSLFLIDLDHFKAINDTYGHPFGDLCLQLTAKAIEQNLQRESDRVARYGGEEFTVILPNTDEEGAYRLAQSLRKMIAAVQPYINGKNIRLTASIGVVTLKNDNYLDASELLEASDQALYKAKENGRNRVEVAETAIDKPA